MAAESHVIGYSEEDQVYPKEAARFRPNQIGRDSFAGEMLNDTASYDKKQANNESSHTMLPSPSDTRLPHLDRRLRSDRPSLESTSGFSVESTQTLPARAPLSMELNSYDWLCLSRSLNEYAEP